MITLTDELRKYREQEVNVMASIIRDMLRNNVGPEYFKGSIDAINRIIGLPKKLAGENKEQQAIAELLMKEAKDLLEKRTTRELLEAE
jgi:hypothetical protein